jgi:MraZ protein
VFRGLSALSLDAKGRLAVPARYRARLAEVSQNTVVLTLNPLDRCLWLYPLSEWEVVETKLQELSDFDKQSRRTKQIMRGYATECELDGHGRILLPQTFRDLAALNKDVVLLGQGNKLEIWDVATWNRERDTWLAGLHAGADEPAESLRHLSL